jgi:hypothetical protein
MSEGICIIEAMKKTNEEIIEYLTADILDLMNQQGEFDINDPFGDYVMGVIERSQSVLRMLGVPDELIPTNYGVDELA